jgi:hypothetical protein
MSKLYCFNMRVRIDAIYTLPYGGMGLQVQDN